MSDLKSSSLDMRSGYRSLEGGRDLGLQGPASAAPWMPCSLEDSVWKYKHRAPRQQGYPPKEG